MGGGIHNIGHGAAAAATATAAAYKGPSVVKEIIYGVTLGLIAGGFWKMHHWKVQRQTKEFYDMLEKGEISTVVDED